MNTAWRNSLMIFAVAGVLLVTSWPAAGQGLGRRFSLEEFKQMVADSSLVVRGRVAEEPLAVGGDASGLCWRVVLDVLEVVKGKFDGRTLEVRVNSTIEDLSCSRKALVGKEYVLPLVALSSEDLGKPTSGEAPAGKFKLTAGAGFLADTAEAAKLLEIATGKVALAPATTALRLRLDAPQAVYELGKPIPLKAALENAGAEAAAYVQAPCEIRDGNLYLPGLGGLLMIDGEGNPVAAKAALRAGAKPPESSMPLAIAGGSAYQTEIDLARYFELARPGSYSVLMSMETPDGKEAVKSNTLGVRIIEPLGEPVIPTPVTPTAAEELRIPSPDAYQPGETVNGLVALLKPIKPEFEVGEKILLELRLINIGESAANVDTRLERTLSVMVQEQANSPAVRPLLQRFDWQEDAEEPSGELPYAHLEPLAFWGKLIDVNSFYGQDPSAWAEKVRRPGPGVKVSYETHGMTLFSFDSPGVYKIQVTYGVKPRLTKGPRVWAGKLPSNPIFVRVVARKGLQSLAPER